MTKEIERQPDQKAKRGFSGMQVICMVIGAMCIAVFATAFAIKIFLFPAPFKPVVLSEREEQQLSMKLQVFEGLDDSTEIKDKKNKNDKNNVKKETLQPEKYNDEANSREISFSERELNAMVAKNTDLAEKMAIDLAKNMVSIKLLIPVDPDFPILGGKTLKVKAGAELAYREGRPVVKLKGVSIMGVPMPNAWLGGLKNIDLVKEFGTDEGFWKTFSAGVESISVVDGFLEIHLKE